MIVPQRLSIVRGFALLDERLRHSQVRVGGRMPVEQPSRTVVGAPGAPGFLNGWAAAPGWQEPCFWKSYSGWVLLGGVARQTTAANRNLAIFNLPSQHRPPVEIALETFMTRWLDRFGIPGGGHGGGGRCMVEVGGEATLGPIRPIHYEGYASGRVDVGLDGIMFRVT